MRTPLSVPACTAAPDTPVFRAARCVIDCGHRQEPPKEGRKEVGGAAVDGGAKTVGGSRP